MASSVGLATLIGAGVARADDHDRDLRDYYGGERTSAYAVGGLGAAAVAAGAYLATRDGDLARGLGWTWIGMGGLEALGAVVYAATVNGEIAHYESALRASPEAYRAEEADHIRGTSSRFVVYRSVELGLTLGGAALAGYGFAAGRGTWQGVGIGVASLALPFLVIDTVNDARAKRYLGDVTGGAPTVSLIGVTPTDGGAAVLVGGRF